MEPSSLLIETNEACTAGTWLMRHEASSEDSVTRMTEPTLIGFLPLPPNAFLAKAKPAPLISIGSLLARMALTELALIAVTTAARKSS